VNKKRTKRLDVAAGWRQFSAAMPSPTDPPRGWMALSGYLEPDRTVFGFMARGDEVRGNCHHRDCTRRCSIDFTELAAKGFGRVHVEHVKRMLMCNRLDGCSLAFHDKAGRGLSLRALLGHAHASIRFRCRACKHHHTALPDAVIAKLRAAGREAKSCDTVEGLAAVTKSPCPNCKKVDWQIDVLWPNVNSVGYRIEQQRKAEARGVQ
jgi:hypothetical protein